MTLALAVSAIATSIIAALAADIYRNRHTRRLNRLVRRSRGRW
jgi:hypothetical protein